MHQVKKSNRIIELIMSVICFAGKACRAEKCGLLLLFFASGVAHAAPPPIAGNKSVTIVLSEKNGFYEEYSKTLDRLLSSANISHRVIDTSQPVPDSGLVIGVGIKAATALAASDAPAVINVLLTKTGYEKLLHEFPARAASPEMTAIYLNQPVERQIQLVVAILPDKRNVGILYTHVSKELNEIHQELKEHSLKLQEQKVDNTQTLPDALKELLLGRSEMLLALPDAEIYNDSTIRNILLATYRRGIPLIGYSASYVKAGALCAVFSSPTQIAAQTAKLIVKFNEKHSLPPAQYPDEFQVLVNTQVAASLGLEVKDASELHDEIEQYFMKDNP
jgi:ABC-type uncharacterized transport system substrate-binding protein